LGVGFFYHLTHQLQQLEEVVFIERRGSASAQTLRTTGLIRIETATAIQEIPTAQILKPDLLTCQRLGLLPEVVLVCPNPDQLLDVITTCAELLVQLYEAGQSVTTDFPLIVLCSNGIYFQRFRQIFIEKIEEAILFGRLPDLWPEQMPLVVARLLRGVTIQTGVRDGNCYRPGPRSLTRIAGGNPQTRARCCQLLTEKGGWYEEAQGRTPTRLEFDKALVNLACNLLGQLYAIDSEGRFKTLTIKEILTPAHELEVRELVNQVIEVGKAVKAYPLTENSDQVYLMLQETCHLHQNHVPSSLQWVDMKLRLGTLTPELTPTESWLIDPLIRYGMSAGLEDAVNYFAGLKQRLLQKLTLACCVTHR